MLAKVGEKVGADLRSDSEKANGLVVVWCSLAEATEKFAEQERLVREGRIQFYNTGFNVVRDLMILGVSRN